MTTPEIPPRWYCISNTGLATPCDSQLHAEKTASENCLTFPSGRPYQTKLLGDARALTAERDRLAAEVEALRTALRIAREGYASEAVTGLPVLPQWRERTVKLIDAAMKGKP